MKEATYAEAGVDLSKIREAHSIIARELSKTFRLRESRFGEVLAEVGHYAGVIDLGRGRALTLHVDGVGTKVLVAQMMKRFDTIGIDCVAMCVNDLVCLGSEPVALVDYIALEKADEALVERIVTGLVKGAEEAGVAIVGGETAVMPRVIKGVAGMGFDLAAMGIGVVQKKKMITGKRLRAGDVVVGVESSGIHSNGLSLARKVLLSKYGVEDYVDELGRKLGEELLEPTRIYVKPILEALQECEVHGLAHITGGGFSKLKRLIMKRNLGFRLDSMPPAPPLFKLIHREGKVSPREMYRTFNMGVGFCVCTPRSKVDKVSSIFEKHGFRTHSVGSLERIEGVYVGDIRVDH